MSLYVKIKKNLGAFSLDVEFEAENGMTGLLGASGCGKSVTLKCIAGVIRPDECKIIRDGTALFDSARNIDVAPQARNVGLLFQNCALFPNMTVARNIACVIGAASRKNRAGYSVAELARKFRLEGLENHYPAELSGGQRQRAALARIFASGAETMMLDEPLSALDSYLRWQLERELAQILGEFPGVALYVSHNRDEVYRLCENVCVINEGRSEPLRSIRELFESPDTFASSLLSGCKNYSRAEKTGDHAIRALDWNVTLRCGREVPDGTAYVGARAHFVRLAGGADAINVIHCRVCRVTRDVFQTIVDFVPDGAPPENDFSHIRSEMPREAAAGLTGGESAVIAIRPEDVMPLKA